MTHDDGGPPPPRYTRRPFPAYRYLPGRDPHPRRDPRGHSHAEPELPPEPVAPERWHESATYLYGIDLFNHGYYWECHEQLEALWRAAAPRSPQRRFLQAVILTAAAELRRQTGSPAGAVRLARKALHRFESLPDRYMGTHVPSLTRALEHRLTAPAALLPGIHLCLCRLQPGRQRPGC